MIKVNNMIPKGIYVDNTLIKSYKVDGNDVIKYFDSNIYNSIFSIDENDTTTKIVMTKTDTIRLCGDIYIYVHAFGFPSNSSTGRHTIFSFVVESHVVKIDIKGSGNLGQCIVFINANGNEQEFSDQSNYVYITADLQQNNNQYVLHYKIETINKTESGDAVISNNQAIWYQSNSLTLRYGTLETGTQPSYQLNVENPLNSIMYKLINFDPSGNYTRKLETQKELGRKYVSRSLKR